MTFTVHLFLKRSIFLELRNTTANLQKCFSNIGCLPELDFNYLFNNHNREEISNNIISRKGVGNIEKVLQLKAQLATTDTTDSNYVNLHKEFCNELLKIPNKTHPDVVQLQNTPRIVRLIGDKRAFNYKPIEFYEIVKRLNLIRTEHLGNVSGSRSYFILGEMAELEQALINYTLDSLERNNFKLISVPDILERNTIEACGLNTKGSRTQVYTLEPKMYGPDLCLSGTSEIAIAGYLANKTFTIDELPIKLTAVSRCYRAEVSSTAEEKGIFRVHQFTKVEMFAITLPNQSDQALEEFRNIEEENFGSLGLHLKTLDMPPHELGAPAYRKYDIEAWLPGRNMFGEISSCSNCTDFQSRRLRIKYKDRNGELKYVHTLNGTACAIPRMLIALTETFQSEKGFIEIPEVLQKYMYKKFIGKQKQIPELKLVKNKR